MKKNIILILILILSICVLAFKSSTVNTFPLFGKLIVIDPGHGGADPGAVFNNEYEKDYNLDFSKVLMHELENTGAIVILTREEDYDLSSKEVKRKRSDFDNRIALIDDLESDIYISLHMNYLKETNYYGAQVFYSKVNQKNELIAEIIQEELNNFLTLNKDAKKIPNDKYMYNKIKTKGVLIEFGFISSSKDRNNIKNEDYKIELAQSIVNGIIKYLT